MSQAALVLTVETGLHYLEQRQYRRNEDDVIHVNSLSLYSQHSMQEYATPTRNSEALIQTPLHSSFWL
jgi:hypothetical protein